MIAYAYPTIFTPVQAGGWIDPENVMASDGVSAYQNPSYGTIFGTIFSGIYPNIPAGSTINSIKIQVRRRGDDGLTPRMYYFDVKGSDQDALGNETPPNTFADLEYPAAHSYSLSELNGGALKIEVWCTHNTSARRFDLDYVRIKVDYTPKLYSGFPQII